MFSIVDLLTTSIIVLLLFFLFTLFQLEKFFSKPRLYLKFVLIIVIFISVSEELIFLKQYFIISLIYPLIIAGYFSIYPLIYFYERKLVLTEEESNKIINVLIFPILMLIVVSIIFYPLDYKSKLEFINLHIWVSASSNKAHKLFSFIINPAYYIQVIFYVSATLLLISRIRKNTSKPANLLVTKYIMVYIIGVIVIETVLIINQSIFANDIVTLITIEQILSLLFLSLCFYIGIKQPLIIIQSKFVRYSGKLLESYEVEYNQELRNNQEPQNNQGPIILANEINPIVMEKPGRIRLSNSEKKEIKEAIENYFDHTMIYLDPNLKLEMLAKKIHITSRRISIVINEVYGTNFNHFINEYRISEAIKLISQNYLHIKIEEVYTKVGFNSRSAFNAAFKKSTGLSPIDYLKQLSAKQSA